MQEHTTIPFPHPQLTAEDPLTAVLRQGAQRLLAQAIARDRRVRSCIATLLYSMAWRATPHRIPRRGISYRVSGAGMMSGLALPHLYEPGSSLNT